MTECPKCKGYGIVGSAVPDILRGRGHIFSSIECPQCHGSGEVEMTNEEWLKQCTTEQLAEALLNIMANNEFTLYLLHTEKKSVQEMKDAVVEWLKQPHTNE